ncbi:MULTISPECIES: AraC family transcriptional regulator [Pectobacterium]|uniref:Transcriptional regulator, AraC family n=1 Tax=Pectobacterium carotovorum subsp. carotovorum (strain PC1) TaxID=561230 RepID=C6DDY2_PECCP|nr:AraC family transcriptional regulator [Pectobacterium carotovorum]ACT12594.1 transcriptional regulator, AraC family [Pectobacterium carotovorum subsp. carotovorum PC1]
MSSVHAINQSYWFSPRLPHVESRSTYNSSHAYKTHSHAQFSIGAIEHGETRCHYRNDIHHLQVGDLIFIDPQQPHSCNPLPGKTRSYHMLYLDVGWCLDQIATHCGYQADTLHCSCVVLRDPALFTHYQHIITLLYRGEIASADNQLKAMLNPIWQQYCQPASSCLPALPHQAPQTTTHHVRERLLNNLQEAPSLETLAEELNLRRETIVRQFRHDTGITPMAFLNNARIEYAKSLLKQGTPLVDTSYQSGFCDQSHFHKTFVQYTAATPGQYARSIFDNK